MKAACGVSVTSLPSLSVVTGGRKLPPAPPGGGRGKGAGSAVLFSSTRKLVGSNCVIFFFSFHSAVRYETLSDACDLKGNYRNPAV